MSNTRTGLPCADEMLDRMRRIETRLTSYLDAQGHVLKGAKRPRWEPTTSAALVQVASVQTGMKDILDVIPREWKSRVYIVHNGVTLACLEGPPRLAYNLWHETQEVKNGRQVGRGIEQEQVGSEFRPTQD
jgi:hypothetical protein